MLSRGPGVAGSAVQVGQVPMDIRGVVGFAQQGRLQVPDGALQLGCRCRSPKGASHQAMQFFVTRLNVQRQLAVRAKCPVVALLGQ